LASSSPWPLLDDAAFHLTYALRGVGVGLAMVASMSGVTTAFPLPDQARMALILGSMVVAVAVCQLRAGPPPSGRAGRARHQPAQARDQLEVDQRGRKQGDQRQRRRRQERPPVQAQRHDDQDGDDAVRPQP
jgi:hypothetical protein